MTDHNAGCLWAHKRQNRGQPRGLLYGSPISGFGLQFVWGWDISQSLAGAMLVSRSQPTVNDETGPWESRWNQTKASLSDL